MTVTCGSWSLKHLSRRLQLFPVRYVLPVLLSQPLHRPVLFRRHSQYLKVLCHPHAHLQLTSRVLVRWHCVEPLVLQLVTILMSIAFLGLLVTKTAQ